MSNEKQYNGWTNYETWLCALWIDNDQGSYEYWNEAAQGAWDAADEDADDRAWDATRTLSDMLKEHFDEGASELAGVTGFWADLMNSALSEVDWDEIARHFVDEVDKEVEA